MSTPPPIYPSQGHIDPGHSGQPVPTHMAWAIIVTIITLCVCCVIGAVPGVVGIVYASKAKNELDNGQLMEARRAAHTAKVWCWIGSGLGLLAIAYWIFSIVMLLSGTTPESVQFLEQLKAAQGQ